MKDEDVVMSLLDSLPPSVNYLITALETRPISELTLDFITTRLMHKVSKKKEKEPNEMMWPCCHANLKRSTTTNGAPTPQGATIVVSWTTFLAIVKTNARWMQILQVRVMILHLSWEQHMTPHKHFSDIYKHVSDCKVFMGDKRHGRGRRQRFYTNGDTC